MQGGRCQGTSGIQAASSLLRYRFASLRRTCSLMMFLPSIRETPDGFPEAYGQLGDGLQALDGSGRKPVAPGEKQFGIAEDAGQRIVDFVAQNFTEIAGQFVARKLNHSRHAFRQAHTTVEQAGSDGQEMVRTRDKIDGAGGDQE